VRGKAPVYTSNAFAMAIAATVVSVSVSSLTVQGKKTAPLPPIKRAGLWFSQWGAGLLLLAFLRSLDRLYCHDLPVFEGVLFCLGLSSAVIRLVGLDG
jgi:hypothetical protein